MGMGGQSHAPAALRPGKRPGTHCAGDWVRPRAGLDGCKMSHPHGDSIPGTLLYSRISHVRILMAVTESVSETMHYLNQMRGCQP